MSGIPQQTRVLHIDDESNFTDLTATFLEREDDRFVVETAIDADEGLQSISDRPPDCVVSDYNMPGMDGIEFLEAVREEYPDLPFILFTGKGSEAVASEAIAADVTDYLQKDSGSEQYELLANRIRNAVHARREARRADRQEQLMRLTEFAGDTGGFEIDVDSGNLLLTDGTRRLVGLVDDTQITLQEAIELYHPDDQVDVRRSINRAAETGEQTRGTWCLQTLDGDERLVNVTITPATANGDATILRGVIHDVTERRNRRQELEQIETLFQHAQDSLFLINVSGSFTIERVNPAYEETTGLSNDQLEGRTPREILGEQQGATVERRYRDCVERREPLKYTEQLELGAGPTEWETRIAPVVLDGSVEYIVGATRDVTDHEERRQELRRLRQAIDDANVPITLAEPSQEENPLVYANDAFTEVTGYPPEEALGRNCRFLQGEDTDPEKITALRDAIDSEEPITVELRNYRKDGTEFWNRLTVTPIYDDCGQLVRYLGTQEDITERKEREQKLKAERRLIEQAIDTLDELFYVLDTDGTFRRWNDRLPEITGYTDRDLAEMRASELFAKDDRETVDNAIETTLANERATVEADLLTADGHRRPYEFTGTPLTDTDGNVTGLVGIGRSLTERRKQERQFRARIEESNDIITIVDTDGRYQYLSPSFERILGYDPEEKLGETAWEYIHPDDREAVRDTFEEWVTTTDRTDLIEYRFRHADGSWRWIEARGNNQPNDPAVDEFVVTSRDITARKERQQELTRAHDLMSNMEQLADVGAWEYDPESETLTTTDGTRRIYDLGPSADLTLERAFENVHPDDRDLLRDRFDACLETGEPYKMDIRLTTPDRERRWITARGERVTDGTSGNVVRGYIQDITERKERKQELQELKSQYETLAENFPDGAVVLIDANLKYVRAGGRELNNVGLSPDDVEGTNPHDLYPEEVADELCYYYEEALAGSTNTFEQEYGGERYRIQTVPVRTGDEKIDHVMAVSQNITEEAEDRRRLKRQNERLEEFAGIVSHDLRNPLAVAEGYLELAQDSDEGEHIRKAGNAIERCQTLTEDLLTLARKGDRVYETDGVVVANVAEECWETVETAAASLIVEAPQTIEADRSRFRQLLENLYRNAIEHGGDDVTVSVELLADGFAVADTGPGIPESDREEIFRAGYSTSRDGTGFGLRIINRVANAHGWEVTVTESEQGGARFEFTGVRFLE